MNKDMSLYKNRVAFQLPEEFEELKEVSKYFVGNKPDFAFIDKETEAVVSVMLTDVKITDNTIEERLNEYYELYRRSVPNLANSNMAKKKTESGEEIASFYFTSTSANKDLYNFFVLTYLDGHELIFTLHCGLQDIMTYGIKFMHIINSIDILEK